ncbi:kinase-like domain-containing protein [Tuber borchii]|uniref:Kinase-like domain-containing protein n=1 Tax=Tuber borchii TaxID=42251 RepID=A0A2T6ZKZ0_TUBBO|nr:kinase-like domain-containing protein [Tuber borchii]
MKTVQSDLVKWYKLETKFSQDHDRHTRYVEKEKYSAVYKQAQGTTGRYRAVKVIDKRRLPPNFDYSREVLVMALLAKRPELFVKFLGWFEERETLYIAMEYLPEGDLTKHAGSPLQQEIVQTISKQILEGLKVMHRKGISHRDLKPAVLGLDSNSETSVYTNSVDIWSLGCVIYELLAGTHLFASGEQVSRYYYKTFPFPENKLKGLSPPTDDAGISLVKSMLSIRPEDRPTAEDALGNVWLVGLKSGNEDSGDDQDETAQSGGESSWSRKGEDKLTTQDKRKKRRGQRNPITQDNSKHVPGDVSLKANPGCNRVATLLPRKVLGKKRIRSILQTCPQSNTPNTKFNLSIKHVTNENLLLNPRPPTSSPPTPNPHHGNSLQLAPGTNGLIEHTLKNEASAPILDAPNRRIAHSQAHPAGRAGSDKSCQTIREDQGIKSCGTLRLMPLGGSAAGVENPNNGSNTNQNPNTGPNPNRHPSTSSNLSQNNVSSNSSQNPATRSNPNRNPNVNSNPNQNPNAVPNHNPNSNTSLNSDQNPSVR